jgi:hypothetical protein
MPRPGQSGAEIQRFVDHRRLATDVLPKVRAHFYGGHLSIAVDTCRTLHALLRIGMVRQKKGDFPSSDAEKLRSIHHKLTSTANSQH